MNKLKNTVVLINTTIENWRELTEAVGKSTFATKTDLIEFLANNHKFEDGEDGWLYEIYPFSDFQNELNAGKIHNSDNWFIVFTLIKN